MKTVHYHRAAGTWSFRSPFHPRARKCALNFFLRLRSRGMGRACSSLLGICIAFSGSGNTFDDLLEEHKKRLFESGLNERGYFRTVGRMRNSVAESDDTIYVSYLGGSKPESALTERVKNGGEECSNFSNNAFLTEKLVLTSDDFASKNLLERNLSLAMREFFESEIVGESRGLNRDPSEKTYTNWMTSAPSAEPVFRIFVVVDVREVAGILNRSFRTLNTVVSRRSFEWPAKRYKSTASIQVILSDKVIERARVQREFSLEQVSRSASELDLVTSLFEDAVAELNRFVGELCANPDSFEVVAAYDGVRLSAGSHHGIEVGQLFLVSPLDDVFRVEGILAALENVFIAETVQVTQKSSLLRVVAGDTDLVIGNGFKASLLE